MAYEMSGSQAAAGGMADVLSTQRGLQEAAVRPRELEAATSIRESQAKEYKARFANMEKMAGLDKKAAEMLQASGEAATAANLNKYSIQAAAQAGEPELAVKKQREQNSLDSDALKLQASALELETDKNDLMSTHLDSIGSVAEYKEFAQAQLKDAELKLHSSNATPQDAMRLRKIREALANATGWEESIANGQLSPEDADFSKFKQLEITPLVQSLKSAKQKGIDAKNTLDNENRKIQLAETERHNREMEHVRLQEQASKRDGNGLSKQLAFNIQAAKLDNAHDKEVHRIQLEIDKLKTEAPTSKVPGSGIGGSTWFEDEGVNPLITSKEQEIEALQIRHDENLKGLQEALDAGKTFVPKPRSKEVKVQATKESLVAPQRPANVPAGSQYSPSTKTWWKDGKKVG